MAIFRTILFCTDFSETAFQAFDYALNVAETYGASLVIFHAIHQPVYPALAEPYVMSQVVEHAENRLRQEAEEEIRTRYLPRIPAAVPHKVVLRSGPPAQEILQFLREEKVDLVVMGTRGRSPLELLVFGSVAQRVVRRSPCPVLTVSRAPSAA
jgi:nucleotide-binding universal stress UspA family protein